MKERPPIWKAEANILKKQSRTDDMGLGEMLTPPRRKTYRLTECSHRKPQTRAWSLTLREEGTLVMSENRDEDNIWA